MITNINYKHCVCDMCGKTEDIESTLLLPHNWQKVTVFYGYHCCEECTGKIISFIKRGGIND